MNPAEDSSLNGRDRSATLNMNECLQSTGRLDVSEELNFEADEQNYFSVKKTAYQNKDIKLENRELPIEEGEVIEHRASGEIEDGEINDTSNVDSLDIYCRFYKQGNCAFGKDCRYLHLSDKGLYSMFESHPAVSEKVYCQPSVSLDRNHFSPYTSCEETETDWDRTLKEAMMRVKQSREKTAREYDKLYMTIQRDEPASLVSPRKEKDSHLLFRKVHYDYNKESRHGIASTKYNSTKSTFNPQIPYKRLSTTTKRKRRSSRSVSDRSRSRSCSRSARCEFNCRCCQTQSPKYRRHYVPYRRSRNYRRCDSTSSESSLSSSSKRASKRYRKVRSSSLKKHQRKAYLVSSKAVKIIPKHTEILSVKKPDRSNLLDVKKERRSISPKRHVTTKFESSFSESINKSCSDMSISPLSFSSSSRKDAQSEKQSVSYYSPDRNLSDMSISTLSNEEHSESHRGTFCSPIRRPSDMSISPLSDSSNPCEFSAQIEINVTEKLKSSSELKKQDLVSNKLFDGEGSIRLKNISSDIEVKKKMNDPLLMDLMKFHGKFRRNNSTVRPNDVESKTSMKTVTSAVAAVYPETKCHVKGKGKQKTNVIRDKLSKKEILMERLQQVNDAIERKKILARQKTGGLSQNC